MAVTFECVNTKLWHPPATVSAGSTAVNQFAVHNCVAPCHVAPSKAVAARIVDAWMVTLILRIALMDRRHDTRMPVLSPLRKGVGAAKSVTASLDPVLWRACDARDDSARDVKASGQLLSDQNRAREAAQRVVTE